MPVIGPVWALQLYGTLSASGMNGEHLLDFCNAIGLGSQASVVGKSFSTNDVGTIPGVGVGNGVGIMGMAAPAVASSIKSAVINAAGQEGENLQTICDAVANALISQMGLATLISTHTTVFAGVGIISPGSIGVVPSEWGSQIQSAGSSFQGDFWPDLAKAIGEGCANAVKNTGTGNVVIAGSPISPIPLPGTGSGTGNIL